MFYICIKAPFGEPNSKLIYDDQNPDEGYQFIDPKLTREDNSSGSFEFEVPLENVGADDITPYPSQGNPTEIYIHKRGYSNGVDDIYWAGRITEVSKSIENRKAVYAEGILGYLNDTIQTPGVYETNSSLSTPRTLTTYLKYLIETRHNSFVTDNKKLYIGLVTATFEDTKWYTNFETTMDIIMDIVSATSGHIRIRRGVKTFTVDGNDVEKKVWYLDLLNDDQWNSSMSTADKWRYIWVPNTDQQIEYSVNLSELTQSRTISDITTVIYPLGKRKDESSIEGVDQYYTICGYTKTLPAGYTAVTDQSGNNLWGYIKSPYGAENKAGFLAAVANFDDVESANELVDLGIALLTVEDGITYEVEASVVDGSLKDRSLKPIELYDLIEVIALPQGFEGATYMKVSKTEITLDDPSKSIFTIGGKAINTFTKFNSNQNKDIVNNIRYLTTKPYDRPDPPEEQNGGT